MDFEHVKRRRPTYQFSIGIINKDGWDRKVRNRRFQQLKPQVRPSMGGDMTRESSSGRVFDGR